MTDAGQNTEADWQARLHTAGLIKLGATPPACVSSPEHPCGSRPLGPSEIARLDSALSVLDAESSLLSTLRTLVDGHPDFGLERILDGVEALIARRA